MKINLGFIFQKIDGGKSHIRDPILDKDKNQIFSEAGVPQFKDGELFTLKKAITDTLFDPPIETDARSGNPVPIPVDEKEIMYRLLRMIMDSKGIIEIKPGDADFLQKLIYKKYNSPWTGGQAKEALDPDSSINPTTEADKKKDEEEKKKKS